MVESFRRHSVHGLGQFHVYISTCIVVAGDSLLGGVAFDLEETKEIAKRIEHEESLEQGVMDADCTDIQESKYHPIVDSMLREAEFIDPKK